MLREHDLERGEGYFLWRAWVRIRFREGVRVADSATRPVTSGPR